MAFKKASKKTVKPRQGDLRIAKEKAEADLAASGVEKAKLAAKVEQLEYDLAVAAQANKDLQAELQRAKLDVKIAKANEEAARRTRTLMPEGVDLRRFAQHTAGCKSRYVPDRYDDKPRDLSCNCGLEAALA